MGPFFPVGVPAPEGDVVDREDFIPTVAARLADGQSLVLSGPRRTGKTSVAREILRRLRRDGLYVAQIDLFAVSDVLAFAYALIDSCLENVGLRGVLARAGDKLGRLTGTARFELALAGLKLSAGTRARKENPEDLLANALELPERLAARDGRRMVVLFDEFQEVTRLGGPDLLKRLRAHFQDQPHVAYFFLGSKYGLLKTLFASNREAFYRFAAWINLPPIPQAAWTEYLTRKFTERNIRLLPDAADTLVSLTEGHPYDTMSVASAAYYAARELGLSEIDTTTVRLAYERAMLELEPVFTETLEAAARTPVARSILFRLAAGQGPYAKGGTGADHSQRVRRALKELVDAGILVQLGRGQYRFTEPAFRDFLSRLVAGT